MKHKYEEEEKKHTYAQSYRHRRHRESQRSRCDSDRQNPLRSSPRIELRGKEKAKKNKIKK